MNFGDVFGTCFCWLNAFHPEISASRSSISFSLSGDNRLIHRIDLSLVDLSSGVTLQFKGWSQAVIVDREGLVIKIDAFRLLETRQFVLCGQSQNVSVDLLFEGIILA